MDVSKVTISQETKKKLAESMNLTMKRKGEIRLNGIKALIRSKPAGHKFRLVELINAAGYHHSGSGSRGYQAGSAYITYLVKHGKIIRHNKKGFKSEYAIPEDVKSTMNPVTVVRRAE